MSNLEHGEINMAVQECSGCLSCDIALESSFTAPRIITLIPPEESRHVFKLAFVPCPNFISTVLHFKPIKPANDKHHEASHGRWYRDGGLLCTRDALCTVYWFSLLEVWLSYGVLYGYGIHT
jgi:hypothetical protein